MNQNQISNPLDTIIDFAWAAGADRFWVNNAKDELNRLRKLLENYIKNESTISDSRS